MENKISLATAIVAALSTIENDSKIAAIESKVKNLDSGKLSVEDVIAQLGDIVSEPNQFKMSAQATITDMRNDVSILSLEIAQLVKTLSSYDSFDSSMYALSVKALGVLDYALEVLEVDLTAHVGREVCVILDELVKEYGVKNIPIDSMAKAEMDALIADADSDYVNHAVFSFINMASPMNEKVKEALFNIRRDRISDSRVGLLSNFWTIYSNAGVGTIFLADDLRSIRMAMASTIEHIKSNLAVATKDFGPELSTEFLNVLSVIETKYGPSKNRLSEKGKFVSKYEFIEFLSNDIFDTDTNSLINDINDEVDPTVASMYLYKPFVLAGTNRTMRSIRDLYSTSTFNDQIVGDDSVEMLPPM